MKQFTIPSIVKRPQKCFLELVVSIIGSHTILKDASFYPWQIHAFSPDPIPYFPSIILSHFCNWYNIKNIIPTASLFTRTYMTSLFLLCMLPVLAHNQNPHPTPNTQKTPPKGYQNSGAHPIE